MELIRGLHNLAPRHRGCVISIGNFDGMHHGHQALIARLKTLSQQYGLPATIVIFEPTPREFFARKSQAQSPPRVAGFRGKLRALERAGVARVLCLRFDKKLAAMSADEFIHRVMVDGLGARAIVVGSDFRFGSQRSGDFALLQQRGAELGFDAERMDSVFSGGERSSSTALRQALAIPDLASAARMLGREYRIMGRVRHGLALGHKLGMPTANISVRRSQALAHGIYTVRAHWAERPDGAPAVASLGVRPTFGMTVPVLEVYVFDYSGSLYGVELEVGFHRYLRPQVKFDSMAQLAEQMQADGRQARAYFEELKTTT